MKTYYPSYPESWLNFEETFLNNLLVSVTEKQFRNSGYTNNARNYPLYFKAFLLKCEFNGITPEQAPISWYYAPNLYMQKYWNNQI